MISMTTPKGEKRSKKDITSHIAIGGWIAFCVNNSKYRWGGIILAIFWLAYEVMEAWRKGDEAYNEIREAIIGICGILAFLRFWNWFTTRPAPKSLDVRKANDNLDT